MDPEVHLVLSGVGDRVAGKQHLVLYLRKSVLFSLTNQSSHLRVSQEHGSQGISKCVILFFEDICPKKLKKEIKCVRLKVSRVHLQVSPESLSPAMATNLLTPGSSGLDTLVLVFAIANFSSLCNQQKRSTLIVSAIVSQPFHKFS